MKLEVPLKQRNDPSQLPIIHQMRGIGQCQIVTKCKVQRNSLVFMRGLFTGFQFVSNFSILFLIESIQVADSEDTWAVVAHIIVVIVCCCLPISCLLGFTPLHNFVQYLHICINYQAFVRHTQTDLQRSHVLFAALKLKRVCVKVMTWWRQKEVEMYYFDSDSNSNSVIQPSVLLEFRKV